MLFFQILFVHFILRLMLNEIETDDLVDDVDAQPAILFQRVEKEETEQGGPAGVGQGSDHLNADLVGIAGVKKTLITVEYAGRYDCPDATEAVDLADVQRVVDLVPTYQFVRLNVDLTRDNSDDSGCPEVNVFASSCHADHSSQDAVAELVNVVLVPDLSLLNLCLVGKLILNLVLNSDQEARRRS